MEPEIEYHTRRARDELHYGLTAAVMPVARAHLSLASLHMQRVRELSRGRCKPLLQM
jgi:hypothetical protein